MAAILQTEFSYLFSCMKIWYCQLAINVPKDATMALGQGAAWNLEMVSSRFSQVSPIYFSRQMTSRKFGPCDLVMPRGMFSRAPYTDTDCFNTLRPRQNGRHIPDGIFKWIFLNENFWLSINISLKFVPRGPIKNIPTLVQVMAWRRPGDKPLSEQMMVWLPTHICVTRPSWVISKHVISSGM